MDGESGHSWVQIIAIVALLVIFYWLAYTSDEQSRDPRKPSSKKDCRTTDEEFHNAIKAAKHYEPRIKDGTANRRSETPDTSTHIEAAFSTGIRRRESLGRRNSKETEPIVIIDELAGSEGSEGCCSVAQGRVESGSESPEGKVGTTGSAAGSAASEATPGSNTTGDGRWSCLRCTNLNSANDAGCDRCGSSKPTN